MSDLAVREAPPSYVPLPQPGKVTSSSRQQKRRLLRGDRIMCHRCHVQIQPSAVGDLCFDDGKDSHRTCSEMRNKEILKMAVTFLVENAEQRGRLHSLPDH